MPRLFIEFQLVTHGLAPLQCVIVQAFAELFKTSIVMVSDIGIGLSQLLGDLDEGVALKEMQPQRFSLILS